MKLSKYKENENVVSELIICGAAESKVILILLKSGVLNNVDQI